jgi:signal transduction histidine kinase
VPWARIFGHFASLVYERVSLLENAREGRCQLERVVESRSRLMRGFSHDVKNPLGAADGHAQLLAEGVYGDLTPEQQESVRYVRRAIHGGLSLIDELHELARAETGKIPLRRELLQLGELVLTIGEEYQAAARSKRLALITDVDPRLPMIHCDAARVRQVIGNLVSNAIKYTTKGVVILRARRWPQRDVETATWLLIDVIDTGCGLPADKRALIFEEFTRLEPDKHAGAGLGLAISKHIAEAFGGRITVESTVGHGSTFTLWIPAEQRQTPSPSHPETTMVAELQSIAWRER